MIIEIKRKMTGAVIYSYDVPPQMRPELAFRYAVIEGAKRGVKFNGAGLHDADLHCTQLMRIKFDFFHILSRALNEVVGLRDALIAGKINGTAYQGPCACLVGTIANLQGVTYVDIPNIDPCPARDAERWFRSIKPGDTPQTNPVSKLTVEWIDEFLTK